MGAASLSARMGIGPSAVRRGHPRHRQFRACGQKARDDRHGGPRKRAACGAQPALSNPSEEILKLADIAWRAGEILLHHYANETIATRKKSDQSPVTAADED